MQQSCVVAKTIRNLHECVISYVNMLQYRSKCVHISTFKIFTNVILREPEPKPFLQAIFWAKIWNCALEKVKLNYDLNLILLKLHG